jgi:hypothetical protein
MQAGKKTHLNVHVCILGLLQVWSNVVENLFDSDLGWFMSTAINTLFFIFIVSFYLP